MNDKVENRDIPDQPESDTNPPSGTLGDKLASAIARIDSVRILVSETVAPAEPEGVSGTKAVAERTLGAEGEEDTPRKTAAKS